MLFSMAAAWAQPAPSAIPQLSAEAMRDAATAALPPTDTAFLAARLLATRIASADPSWADQITAWRRSQRAIRVFPSGPAIANPATSDHTIDKNTNDTNTKETFSGSFTPATDVPSSTDAASAAGCDQPDGCGLVKSLRAELQSSLDALQLTATTATNTGVQERLLALSARIEQLRPLDNHAIRLRLWAASKLAWVDPDLALQSLQHLVLEADAVIRALPNVIPESEYDPEQDGMPSLEDLVRQAEAAAVPMQSGFAILLRNRLPALEREWNALPEPRLRIALRLIAIAYLDRAP